MSDSAKTNPNALVPRNEFEEDTISKVSELPIPEQIVERARAIGHTTQQISHTATATSREVVELRGDMRNYVERDLNEHAELRHEIRGVREELKTASEHANNLRVITASMAGDVRRLADREAEAKKLDEEKREEGADIRKYRRGLVITIVGILGTILGVVIHSLAAAH